MILCNPRFFSQYRVNAPRQNAIYVIDLEIAQNSDSTILSIFEFGDVACGAAVPDDNKCLRHFDTGDNLTNNAEHHALHLTCFLPREAESDPLGAMSTGVPSVKGNRFVFDMEPNYLSTCEKDTKQTLIMRIGSYCSRFTLKKDQLLAEIKCRHTGKKRRQISGDMELGSIGQDYHRGSCGRNGTIPTPRTDASSSGTEVPLQSQKQQGSALTKSKIKLDCSGK